MAWQARSFTQIWMLDTPMISAAGPCLPHHPARRVGPQTPRRRTLSPTTQWPWAGRCARAGGRAHARAVDGHGRHAMGADGVPGLRCGGRQPRPADPGAARRARPDARAAAVAATDLVLSGPGLRPPEVLRAGPDPRGPAGGAHDPCS